MLVQGLDLSNYYGYITPQWAAACVEAGIQRATVRLSLETDEHIRIAHHQIATFQDAGIETDGYWWGYPTLDDPHIIAERIVGTYPDLPLYSADMEDEPHSYPNPVANADWLHLALAGFMDVGVQSAIYTGYGYWMQYMGNTEEFQDVPLWVAYWDRTPGDMSFLRFGGWTQAVGKQWCGEAHTPDSIVAGIAVDRSTWDTALLPGVDDLSAEERAELDFLRSWRGLTMNEYPDQLQAQRDQIASVTKAKGAQTPLREIQNVINTLRRGGE